MMKLTTLFYHLTAYLPRRLPRTEAEFLKFKDILLTHYGVEDAPQSYATIAGQIQSTPGHKLRKSYGDIANQCKRLKINALAQCYRVAANQQLRHDLEVKIGQAVETIKEEERSKLTEGSVDVSSPEST